LFLQRKRVAAPVGVRYFEAARMPDLDLAALTQIALEVARVAAAGVRAGYRSQPEVERKLNYSDLVTRYDRESEQCIRQLLARRTPELTIVGEEEGGTVGEGPTWFCDPIDGTINFAHGHPFHAISIGLMLQGRPLLGAVVAPALQVEWHGHVGGGAFRNGVRCQVSDTNRLPDALLATGFSPLMRERGHPEDNIAAYLRVAPAARAVRVCGAAALDLCLVADGTYDAYWERRLAPWDMAAGAALLLAAGGRITSLTGAACDFSRGYLLASNGHVHAALLPLLETDGAPS
jgi:myo-inositol-1(or 4)-monophosphatase